MSHDLHVGVAVFCVHLFLIYFFVDELNNECHETSNIHRV